MYERGPRPVWLHKFHERTSQHRHPWGFKTLKMAYAMIKGFEAMRALRKRQADAFNLSRYICGEARLFERAFGLAACAIAEAVPLTEGHRQTHGTRSKHNGGFARTAMRQTAPDIAVCNRAAATSNLNRDIWDEARLRVPSASALVPLLKRPNLSSEGQNAKQPNGHR